MPWETDQIKDGIVGAQYTINFFSTIIILSNKSLRLIFSVFISFVALSQKCFFQDTKIPWCSGYHVSLTHSRSPVRSRAESPFLFFNYFFIIIFVFFTGHQLQLLLKEMEIKLHNKITIIV